MTSSDDDSCDALGSYRGASVNCGKVSWRASRTELHIGHDEAEMFDQIMPANVVLDGMRDVRRKKDLSPHTTDDGGIAQTCDRTAVAMRQRAGIDSGLAEFMQSSAIRTSGCGLLQMSLQNIRPLGGSSLPSLLLNR